LNLSASGGFSASSFTQWLTWPSRFWTVGGAAAETLFDFGKRRALVGQTAALYDVAVANYRQAVLIAFQQVEDSLAALRYSKTKASRKS